MEGVTDKARTTGTLSSVIGRRADGIFTTKELLARILANIDVIRAMDADGIGGAHVVVEAFVWNNLTTDGEIVRSSGVSFQAGTRHKVIICLADGVRAAEICGTAVDAGFYTVLV